MYSSATVYITEPRSFETPITHGERMQRGRTPEGRERKRITTPQGELAKLQEQRARDEHETRQALMDSMLDVCGEFGYRQVTVETVYRRYGCSRSHFYRHFASKADCFVAAYDRECERLNRLSFEPEPLERKRLQEALERLGSFVSGEPLRARALFVEAHVAGGDVVEKRWEVLERLSLALNKAGRETKSRHSPPPLAGELMVNVIDQAVSSALINGEPAEFERAVPELTDLICQVYGKD